MAKVLITGANGFLGSWITKTLVKDGHDVSALVRKSSDLSELEGVECKYQYGDVTDANSLDQATKGIEAVFHAAGVISYKKIDRQKMDFVNVQGTHNVINACHKNEVSRLVNISSVVAIGAGFTSKEILNEESTFNLGHLNLGYFETKRLAEVAVRKATLEKKIDSVILNPATIYGYGDARKGSRKNQIKVAQGKLRLYTSGGVSVVAAEDVVAGILSAWKKGRSGERYILAGENLTLRQVFELIANEAGVKPPDILVPNFILHALGWLGDLQGKFGSTGGFSSDNAHAGILFHWFSNDKAKKELNFNPRPAKDAIRNSVQWMRENGIIK